MGLMDKTKKQTFTGTGNTANALKRGSVVPGKPLEGLNGVDASGNRGS
jgi:hypothetical protein